MADLLYDILTSSDFQPNHSKSLREQISLSEKGTTYVLKMNPKMDSCSFRVDGYIINSPSIEKCDYVVLVSHDTKWAEIVVELKGGKIEHAIEQLYTTISTPPFNNTQHSIRRARIVTQNRIPANTGNSVLERAKVEFKKRGCDLKAVKSNQPDFIKASDF